MMQLRRAPGASRGYPFLSGLVLAVLFAGLSAGQVRAELIKNPIAVFAALDKVTGRISHLEIPINQTV